MGREAVPITRKDDVRVRPENALLTYDRYITSAVVGVSPGSPAPASGLRLNNHPGIVLGVGRGVIICRLKRQGGGLVNLKLGDEIGEAARDLF